MKVHLSYDDDFYRAGYVNVDRFPRNEHQQAGDVGDLSWLLDSGEASEIVAYRILDRFHHDRVQGVVEGWVGKLAPGGVLTVVGTDLFTIVNKVYTRRLSVADANRLIYGNPGPKGRLGSTLTISHLESLMRSLGLVVVGSRYEDDDYVVKGKRP